VKVRAGEDVCARVGNGEGTGVIGAFGGTEIFTLSTYHSLLRVITLFRLFCLNKRDFG